MLYTDNTVFSMLEFLVENLFLDFGGNSMFVLYKKNGSKEKRIAEATTLILYSSILMMFC